ncbi:phosphotransferase family protein [Thermoactinospora rubra]|uniref:phosphotransferase family protein n=1 Tax=Thermoactinospora rubra TaxID=1088767 RepID=UPI000A11F5E7|nr:aminoglycoside phosphotransferase family protein [Thermoactinospora rubra]
MEFRPIERPPGAFQQPVTEPQLVEMCRRAFGQRTGVVSAVELGNGLYNTTYLVDLGSFRSILRVAPCSGRQFASERGLMRNEHAAVPYFAPIASLLPRTLAIDFTHEIVERDYMFQSVLEGVPAPDGLPAYPRSAWDGFYRQLGEIARTVHSVRGERFGPVAGPGFPSWSAAVIAALDEIADDLQACGLESSLVRSIATCAVSDSALLDEITTPRLLHGDLWTVNVMIASGTAEPTITGVFDCDRALWGDPAADWTIFLASRKPRAAFWEGYGPQPDSRRSLYYRARHVASIILERHRLGNADLGEAYRMLREVLAELEA